MNDAWDAAYRFCLERDVPSHLARRTANLALAAVMTASEEDEDDAIATRVPSLMVAPTFDLSLSPAECRSLLALMRTHGAHGSSAGARDVHDSWVRAFQCADGSRKNLGAYATPANFADALAKLALDPLRGRRALRIVDPACGAGALLTACLECLHPKPGAARRKAALQLYGMELDPAARELACLHVWMAAGANNGDLTRIVQNIRLGNALIHPWGEEAPYDVLVMNPPWESLRHKSGGTSQREREITTQRISKAHSGAEGLPALYSAQGSGDRNLCKAFIELAPHLLTQGGRIAALVPSAFASDEGMRALRQLYLKHFALESWTGYENRAKAFDIDSRYKFGLLTGTRSPGGTDRIDLRAFAVHPKETCAPHVRVSRTQLTAIGGAVGIIPDITSARELEVLSIMHAAGISFFAESELGRVGYRREVDLTMGRRRGLFDPLGKRAHVWNDDATIQVDGQTHVPILEGRMVGQYDFFQKSWVEGTGRTAVWRHNGVKPLGECRPQFVTRPMKEMQHRLAICDVTSATNARTVHATVVPDGWICGNTAPILRFENAEAMYAGLAILNSMVFDWLARRMVSGLHLNKFYLSCMAWPSLTSLDMRILSNAGKVLAAAAPRWPRNLPAENLRSTIELKSMIEATTAKGYNLDSADLEFMLEKNVEDRRGFWRFYATHPHNEEVAKMSSRRLSGFASSALMGESNNINI